MVQVKAQKFAPNKKGMQEWSHRVMYFIDVVGRRTSPYDTIPMSLFCAFICLFPFWVQIGAKRCETINFISYYAKTHALLL